MIFFIRIVALFFMMLLGLLITPYANYGTNVIVMILLFYHSMQLFFDTDEMIKEGSQKPKGYKNR